MVGGSGIRRCTVARGDRRAAGHCRHAQAVPHDQTTKLDDILGTSSTINSAGSRELGGVLKSDGRISRFNGFATEFLGTLVLALAALVMLDGPSLAGAPGAAAIGVGFLVWGLVAGLAPQRSRAQPRP